MNIALDYDDTFTEDPDFWFGFLGLASNRHKVYIVTFRSPERCMAQDFNQSLKNLIRAGYIMLVPTSLKAKKQFCLDKGIKIDVWIDDNPASIYKDHPACYEKEF